MQRILIAEDNIIYARSLKAALEAAGYRVTVFVSCEAALGHLARYDCYLIEMRLPGQDGFALIRQIRRVNGRAPVIMISAYGNECDRIRAFKSGAVAFLDKPVNTALLQLRIARYLKRRKLRSGLFRLSGTTVFDSINHVLSQSEQQVKLTPRESQVLRMLCHHPGRAFLYDEILEMLWGNSNAALKRSMDTIVYRLRKKLESPHVQIETVRNLGIVLHVNMRYYRVEEPVEAGGPEPGKLGYTELQELYRDALAANDPALNQALVAALLDHESEYARDLHYQAMLQPVNLSLQRCAAMGFQHRGRAGGDYLIGKLLRESPSAKRVLLKHMGFSGNRGYASAVARQLGDADELVRLEAAMALAWIGNAAHFGDLIALIAQGSAGRVRAAAAFAAYQISLRHTELSDSFHQAIKRLKQEGDDELVYALYASLHKNLSVS